MRVVRPARPAGLSATLLRRDFTQGNGLARDVRALYKRLDQDQGVALRPATRKAVPQRRGWANGYAARAMPKRLCAMYRVVYEYVYAEIMGRRVLLQVAKRLCNCLNPFLHTPIQFLNKGNHEQSALKRLVHSPRPCCGSAALVPSHRPTV